MNESAPATTSRASKYEGNHSGYTSRHHNGEILISQELEELKKLKFLAEGYGWKDDDPRFLKRKAQLMKELREVGRQEEGVDRAERRRGASANHHFVAARGGADHQGLRPGDEDDDHPRPRQLGGR